MTIDIKRIGDMNVKVVNNFDGKVHEGILSANDAEMDRRANAAVSAAIDKARICRKPIAGYDMQTKRAYIEYPDGRRDYAN